MDSPSQSQEKHIAARDTALNDLFADVAHVSEGMFVTPDALAWSPNGRLLVVAQDFPAIRARAISR